MLEIRKEHKKKVSNKNNPTYETDIKKGNLDITTSIEKKSTFKKK